VSRAERLSRSSVTVARKVALNEETLR
jgi:hypothetical protein